MKKIIALLLLTALCFSLTSCGFFGVFMPFSNQKQEKYQAFLEWDELYPYGYLEDENGNLVKGDESLKLAYALLQELDGFKDSEEYLSRFLIVENTLSYISKIDAFGQVANEKYKTYNYNKEGVCFVLSDTYDFLIKIGVKPMEALTKFVYDSNNLLSEIIFTDSASEDASVRCKIALVYDTNGNITKAKFQQANGGSWTNTFTYDDQNRMTKAEIARTYDALSNTAYNYTDYIEHYTYDDNGKLTQTIRENQWKEEYTYTAKGRLHEVKRFKRGLYHNSFVTEESYKETYTYYESGRISSIQVIDDEKEYKLVYHYEDVYVYNRNS